MAKRSEKPDSDVADPSFRISEEIRSLEEKGTPASPSLFVSWIVIL